MVSKVEKYKQIIAKAQDALNAIEKADPYPYTLNIQQKGSLISTNLKN